MRALSAAFLLLGAAAAAWAQAPHAARCPPGPRAITKTPRASTGCRADFGDAVKRDPSVDNLLALAQVCFIWGDIRARTADEKLDAYEQGRRAARRAVELAPRRVSSPTSGTRRMRAAGGRRRESFARSSCCPPSRRRSTRSLELDPTFPPVYSLAGYVAYEVPVALGGDLDRAEQMFRKGLTLDPRFTGMRVGLGKTLIKKGRLGEARKELEAVLAERAPSNIADWALKDSVEARELLASLRDKP